MEAQLKFLTGARAEHELAQIFAPEATPGRLFEGYVEFYGYHILAGGWCLAGWISRHDDLLGGTGPVEAHFEGDMVSAEAIWITYNRDDVAGRDAIGFLIFLPASTRARGPLCELWLNFSSEVRCLKPVQGNCHVRGDELVAHLKFLLLAAEAGPRRSAMELRLFGLPEKTGTGFIEYYGYHHTADGWFFAGWMNHAWPEAEPPEWLLIYSDGADVRTTTVPCLYTRIDLPADATGVVFFVPGKQDISGLVSAISLRFGDKLVAMQPVADLPCLREAELSARIKDDVAKAKPDLYRDSMVNIVSLRPYAGEDTLEALSPSVFLFVDHAFLCGTAGLLLMGWMLVKPEEIREIRVRCGNRIAVLQPQSFVRVPRQDVLEGYAKFGFEDANCGFITYIPDIAGADAKLYIEVETIRSQFGYRNLPPLTRGGINAIRQLLGTVDIRFGELAQAFDAVLGPAVEAMNAERLSQRVSRQVVEYGAMPRAPKYSVLVPLYGRLDFVEYQMALFSARASNETVEYVFVLDDPPRRREAQLLFTSVYERFGIPFRAVLLERNLGFAPANNVGMAYCTGEYLIYLNSDVFPGSLDWLERLSARLEAEPELGVVGPLLLFEDGAVQHRGMFFERLEEYADWHFCQHLDKGLRFSGGGLEYFISITGACMMLRRELAMQLGGFDEIYAIGDFEDSDLCLKIQERGYKCAVDNDVTLYHLERKSQISGALTWRANLTAYNAWQHERRWSKLITRKQAHEFRRQK